MRHMRYFTPLIAAAGTVAAILIAPAAVADTTLPSCTSVGGVTDMGAGTTECATPGNVQLNATPPEPDYVYPWDDEFYGSALIMGGGDYGPHGGGGHGGR
jgi:hypothetical protein